MQNNYFRDRRFSDYRAMIEKTAPDAVYAIGQPHYRCSDSKLGRRDRARDTSNVHVHDLPPRFQKQI